MVTNSAVMTTLMKPYDASSWDHWSMYDNMPYIWDPDLNTERVFKYVTGNIIKGYRCNIIESIEIKHD
jgi:hypothetical protein